jgi:hypothetical protein
MAGRAILLAMGGIRRRLYACAWILYGATLALVWSLLGRMPEHLPAPWGSAWTDRNTFFGVQFGVLGLILLFSIPIDRVLLKRTGDNAFLACITLFMTLLFALLLTPVVWIGLSAPKLLLAWSLAASFALGACGAGYLVRMRTLAREGGKESEGAAYYRTIRPGVLMGIFPPAYPFFPYSVEARDGGLRVKGPLMDCRWDWGQVASARPGRPAQAYAGMAVRLTASGRDVVIVGVRDLKWPVVLNAPDRARFFEAVRTLAPGVEIPGDA